MQRQVKLLYCAANKLRVAFAHCFTAVENTLSHAHAIYACQVWCWYAHSRSKLHRVSLSNFCIESPVTWVFADTTPLISSGQFIICIEPMYMPMLNNEHRHPTFYTFTSNVWCFLQISIFLQYRSYHLYDDSRMQQLLVSCFGVRSETMGNAYELILLTSVLWTLCVWGKYINKQLNYSTFHGSLSKSNRIGFVKLSAVFISKLIYFSREDDEKLAKSSLVLTTGRFVSVLP